MNLDMRLRSAPFPVIWAGFRSTTTEMQQAGWQIAVDFEPYRLMYTLMFRHREMALYAITDSMTFEQQVVDYRDVHHLPPFHIRGCAPRIEFLRMPTVGTMNFQEIDAVPNYQMAEYASPEDMNVFNVVPRQQGGEEIIVNPADMTVIEHLEAIKELQSEEQKRIRERMLKGPVQGETFESQHTQTEVVANVIAIHQ